MSPRISYWTGWLDPQMVAVSKEVYQLWQHFPGSWVFGVSSHYTLRVSRRWRTFGIHHRGFNFFRPFIPLLESRFDVSHIYTSLADWHFLQVLGNRPIVLTATESAARPNPRIVDRVAHVVAESEQLQADARAAGMPADRVSVIYPGVDLVNFHSTPPPALPWKCLFASSPEGEREIPTKGVDLLLELARAMPELRITVLWRPFGRQSDKALNTVRAERLSNLEIVAGRVQNIQDVYRSHHFTIAPFRTTGKPCPNSILESLACGRPVLVSSFVHIGELLERERAGISFATNIDDLQAAVHRLLAGYDTFQAAARACAESHFDLDTMIRAYGRLYDRLCSRRVA
jgi:glycosyltransferase involved in cell wall biosynthesis